MDWKKTLLICAVILLVGLGATAVIFTTEPVAEQSGATKQTAMLVDVVTVEKGDFRPVIRATGVVRPSKEISLSPRVSGEITEISKNFTPGGFVNRGDMLITIDTADYEINLEQQQSALHQAEANLKIEMGLQQVARKEYKLLEDTMSNRNQDLLLREPQLQAARAEVETARANVKQAQLDLARTTIRAPFNAHIVDRTVNIGSQITNGQILGRVVGLDEYWIEANISMSKLKWLSFAEDAGSKGSTVKIRNRTAWPKDTYREGNLYRLIGALETQTRMARVLITVEDPLSRSPENADEPGLMIGAFMESDIEGKVLENVVKVDRDLIRGGNTVWVNSNNKLRIEPVTIQFQDAEYAYISEGLEDGAEVVTTNLSTVVDGTGLRLTGDSSESYTE